MLTHHGLKMLGCMKKCHTPNFIWFSIDPLETGIKISEFPLKNGDFQLLSTGVLSHCKLYIYRLYSDFLVCHHITIKESYSNAVFWAEIHEKLEFWLCRHATKNFVIWSFKSTLSQFMCLQVKNLQRRMVENPHFSTNSHSYEARFQQIYQTSRGEIWCLALFQATRHYETMTCKI